MPYSSHSRSRLLDKLTALLLDLITLLHHLRFDLGNLGPDGSAVLLTPDLELHIVLIRTLHRPGVTLNAFEPFHFSFRRKSGLKLDVSCKKILGQLDNAPCQVDQAPDRLYNDPVRRDKDPAGSRSI